ncbi:MAG: diacylglycerol kinase [Acidimicrobiia bacterium]|nr:diacylglycerol kinase [Acidimicrobiia bacterium]
MAYKVIQWATGNVGSLALRGIIEHPELELVGLLVHSPAKAGQDAGTLAGVGAVGVKATNDVDEVLALDADAVSYMATGDLRPWEAVEDMARILESGKNVVSTSVVPLIYPPCADSKSVERLEAACLAGDTSCFTSGIDPGFANDLLPLVVSGVMARIDSLRIMEILNYNTYLQPEVLFETMGFGQSMDHTPLLLLPGILSSAWGPVVQVLAAGLGVELEDVREWYDRVPAAETFDTAVGRVEQGTVAGLRFEVQGVVGGEPRIIVEHVTRMHDDVAPDWPQPAGKGCYRLIVRGNPNIQLDLQMEGEDGDHNTGGLWVTAMRVLNAVPAVCAAPPGLLSALDVPLVTGRGLVAG